MQMSGNGTGRAVDTSAIVTQVKTIQEARKLPVGSIVGDKHGGVTFTDAVAAELEKRSWAGWHDLHPGAADARWTVIVLHR